MFSFLILFCENLTGSTPEVVSVRISKLRLSLRDANVSKGLNAYYLFKIIINKQNNINNNEKRKYTKLL